MRDKTISAILGHPLVIAAIGAAFAGYSGYAAGQATTNMRIDRLEASHQRMDGRDDKQDEALAKLQSNTACQTRQLDQLNTMAGSRRLCELGM